jgi:hypothetical protein
MDFVTLTMPCVCTQGSTPGVVRDQHGKPVRCPACGGSTTVPIRCKRQPFDYSFPYLDELGASLSEQATGTIELQLDDDSYFEMEALVGYTTGVGDPGAASVQLSDLSNGWQFSNDFLYIITNAEGNGGAFCGIAPMPAPLLVPYIVRPSSVLQIAWKTIVGGSQFAAQFVFKGYKLYPLDQASADALGSGKAAA